jgi:hypothetical protein
MVRAMKHLSHGSGDETALAALVHERLEFALRLPSLGGTRVWPDSPEGREAFDLLKSTLTDDARPWFCLFGWVFVHALGRIVGEADFAPRSRSWMDEWLLGRILAGVFRNLGYDEPAAWRTVKLIGLLTTHQHWFADAVAKDGATDDGAAPASYRVVEALLKDSDGQQWLGVNRYQEVLWYTGEAFEELLRWLFLVAVIQGADTEEMTKQYGIIRDLQRASRKAEHQVEKLLEAAKSGVTPSASAPA